jgi:hypothetical protein
MAPIRSSYRQFLVGISLLPHPLINESPAHLAVAGPRYVRSGTPSVSIGTSNIDDRHRAAGRASLNARAKSPSRSRSEMNCDRGTGAFCSKRDALTITPCSAAAPPRPCPLVIPVSSLSAIGPWPEPGPRARTAGYWGEPAAQHQQPSQLSPRRPVLKVLRSRDEAGRSAVKLDGWPVTG